ncbi:hypothetical protein [Marinobacter changyiensis]|uniref:hypothetical protein n=1 Tax=Marinobacter changyiensis TaxID=2604091 RepID=UPI001264E796|nr:hypothetical protein [Marinobacter changyiensis]
MDIFRTHTVPLTSLDKPKSGNTQRTPVAEGIKALPREHDSDRRYQPDRRRRQEEFDGADRRKRRTRRSPSLLHPRTGEATPLEDRRGRLVSTRA